jgi:hypothetical protein
MKKYLDLERVITQKDLSPFISSEHLKVHQHIVVKQAVEEIGNHLEVSQSTVGKLK